MRPLFLIFLLLSLVGCGEASEPPPAPASTAARASATLAPTFTLPPAEPTSTPTPEATATPEPTPTPEATATPEFPDFLASPPERAPSPGRRTNNKSYPPGAYEFIHDQFDVPAPPGRVPDEYVASLPGVAEGVCPLTGEAAPEGIQQRRPINVRIDNSPQGRPQAGPERADVLWETIAEGGVTRLTVTFHCQTPGVVGPIRSARLIDLHLTPMLNAWLVHVGASQQVTDMLWAAPYADRSINEWAGDPAFYRIASAPVDWMRTYSNNELIQGVIARKADTAMPTPLRGWLFSEEPGSGSSGSAAGITIPYQPGTSAVVNYRYDAGTGSYFRYQGQGAHTTQNGTHLAPENVIVLFTAMTTTPIVEDSLGSRSMHFDLQGTGEALLFRDGQAWEATWVREGENTMVRLLDDAGNVIPFAVGQTWVQIVPDTMQVTWQ